MVTNLSNIDALVTLDASAPLSAAVEQFSKTKVHRIVILDETGLKCLGILSQSTLATFIVEKFSKFSKYEHKDSWVKGQQSVEALGLITSDIVSLPGDDSVLDAMYQMHKHSVSSIAIVGSSSQVDFLM